MQIKNFWRTRLTGAALLFAVLFAVIDPSALAQKQVAPGVSDEVVAQIYREACASCHDEGTNGAPRPGVKADWTPRLSYGIEGLYFGAMDGIPPQMPERGLCYECSDSQLKAVVDFMLRELE